MGWKILAEAKFGLQRVMMYIGLANFLLLLTLVLKWLHDSMFPATGFYLFVVIGWACAAIGLTVLILVDRRIIVRQEAGIGAKLNPLSITAAFHTAAHVADWEEEGRDTSLVLADLRPAFRMAGLEERFDRYLEEARVRRD